MPQHSFISIPLDIPTIRVTKTEITKSGDLLLTVESLLTSTTCHRCGQTITNRHGYDEPREGRLGPILGRPVYLRLRPKRFRCPHCDGHPTTTQHLDWYDPQAGHTKRMSNISWLNWLTPRSKMSPSRKMSVTTLSSVFSTAG